MVAAMSTARIVLSSKKGKTLQLFGVSLWGLARRFPAVAPYSVQRAFDETLDVLHLNRKRYHLVYIPSEAVRWAERQSKGSVSRLDVGSLGQCVGRTAYVVHSDNGGRASERSTAIHEALHFVFGDHPWPCERR